MKNCNLSLNGTVLTITVDLSKEQGPSKSGKTTVISTTEGNVSLPGHENIKLGLNIYKGK